MHELEVMMKRLLPRMIRGDIGVVLGTEDQIVIAVWALKTAMVMEYLRPRDPQYFTQGERRKLMDAAMPPPELGAHV